MQAKVVSIKEYSMRSPQIIETMRQTLDTVCPREDTVETTEIVFMRWGEKSLFVSARAENATHVKITLERLMPDEEVHP